MMPARSSVFKPTGIVKKKAGKTEDAETRRRGEKKDWYSLAHFAVSEEAFACH
jgi:hypothetical protein